MFLRHLGQHGYLIEGAVTLAKEVLNKNIPYKYWVSAGEGQYEFIYKTSLARGFVNRCLHIRGDLLNSRGELFWQGLRVGLAHGFFGGVIPDLIWKMSVKTALPEAGNFMGPCGCFLWTAEREKACASVCFLDGDFLCSSLRCLFQSGTSMMTSCARSLLQRESF